MTRIVVASNRVAIARDPTKTTAKAGGLAVALEVALRAAGGLWFGWSGEVSKGKRRGPKVVESGGVTYATLDLTAADRNEYYNGFANRTLWPLFHYRTDLTTYDRAFWRGYLRVNVEFARHLAPLLKRDDLVWSKVGPEETNDRSNEREKRVSGQTHERRNERRNEHVSKRTNDRGNERGPI